MEHIADHPDIQWAERTGYPSWNQPSEDEERCGECGRVIEYGEDTYETSTFSILCEDCLKMLHKRW
jgi:hypothetical protein